MKALFPRFVSLILLVCFLLYWEFLSGVRQSYELGGAIPPLSVVWECFLELSSSGVLQSAIVDSLSRFIVGLSVGSCMGIVVGLILGRFVRLELALEPFIQLLRPISPIAWLPIIVFFFGIGELGCIFVIIYAVFFPVLLLSISGVRNIDKALLAMAHNFGAKEGLIFVKIILPGAFVYIASGLKLAASIAWIHLVAGEMLGIQSGLGYLVIDGRNLIRTDMIILSIFFIGILGFGIHLIFSFLEKLILKRLGRGI